MILSASNIITGPRGGVSSLTVKPTYAVLKSGIGSDADADLSYPPNFEPIIVSRSPRVEVFACSENLEIFIRKGGQLHFFMADTQAAYDGLLEAARKRFLACMENHSQYITEAA